MFGHLNHLLLIFNYFLSPPSRRALLVMVLHVSKNSRFFEHGLFFFFFVSHLFRPIRGPSARHDGKPNSKATRDTLRKSEAGKVHGWKKSRAHGEARRGSRLASGGAEKVSARTSLRSRWPADCPCGPRREPWIFSSRGLFLPWIFAVCHGSPWSLASRHASHWDRGLAGKGATKKKKTPSPTSLKSSKPVLPGLAAGTLQSLEASKSLSLLNLGAARRRIR